MDTKKKHIFFVFPPVFFIYISKRACKSFPLNVLFCFGRAKKRIHYLKPACDAFDTEDAELTRAATSRLLAFSTFRFNIEENTQAREEKINSFVTNF